MQFGNKDKEVKTHIPTQDFDEFLRNLASDSLNRSEFIRIKIREYNMSKRSSKIGNKVVNIFSRA